MKNKKKLLHCMLGLAMVLAIVLPLTGPGLVIDASAVTQAEIDALKNKSSDLAAQKKDIQNQLKAVQADKNAALQKKQLLDGQINVLRQEIDSTNELIAMYDRLIAEETAELEQAEADEAAQFDLFCRQMRLMEEQGDISYWSILFSSSDFAELLDNYMMIEEIIEYDNRVIDDLVALQEQVLADRAELEKAQNEQEEIKAGLVAAQNELKAQEKEVDKLIAEISSREDQLESMEADLRKAAAEVDAQIKAKEREYADQITNVPSESGFLWPLSSGYNVLTSLFGPRPHPVTGRPNNHTGIDISAPKNTKIYASKSGVVTTSTYNSSYGEYVVVSHSDNTSTLYAHMTTRNVREGQMIKQGDVVGYVGSTGSSTGNHLHFEVRINNVRQDPVNYFQNKALYARDNGITMPLWDWMK